MGELHKNIITTERIQSKANLLFDYVSIKFKTWRNGMMLYSVLPIRYKLSMESKATVNARFRTGHC